MRAGLITPGKLGEYRWSSLPRFLQRGRPAALECTGWMQHHGWTDSPAGWRAYAAYLTDLATDKAEQKRLGLEKLSAGWAIGTLAWRKKVATDHAHRALSPGLEAGELKEFKESHWSQVLESGLKRAGKTARAGADSPGNAPWKLSLARRLRQAGAGYAWITAALRMGKASSARAYLCQTKR